MEELDEGYGQAQGGAGPRPCGVGPVLEKFPDVSRIAVLRGGGLGDLLFALPAVSALAAAYPAARVTLLGTPGHVELLENTVGPVRDVRVLPVSEGVRPGLEDPAAVESFFDAMKRERFDLAVQVHGGGRFSNPFLLRLGARHTVGLRTPDAAPLERNLPYLYYQHEPLRALEVAGLAGAPPTELEARIRPTRRSAVAAGALLEQLRGRSERPLVAVHPSATDPRRRWPAKCFGEVAAGCAADGCRVVVIGSAAEQELAEEVVAAAGSDLVSTLAGELSLGTLAALLSKCAVLLGNDSGPRHLAQALGTPTVGLFWVGNLINAGPLGRGLHRVQLSWVTRCPECGADLTQVGWTASRCEHDISVLTDISPAEVHTDVRDLTAMSPLAHGR
ncbi:glycosyltransferase family 9 protein [Arthrobacter sp. B3I4]|uniref:glycosyltransferase family 9 protein n=1 Tax=Arthrobacter sp. B3I4 TaxID=3042267 RepID=UPI002786312B|nr:glycosyltransferase family 9 protein [Arthrobacter sp. B3I4]MDQ0755242.1 ADP-heptose:LPS heptosyltransferase [Arthrobacter sp. B3I4]